MRHAFMCLCGALHRPHHARSKPLPGPRGGSIFEAVVELQALLEPTTQFELIVRCEVGDSKL
jgi:hypothetical protein